METIGTSNGKIRSYGKTFRIVYFLGFACVSLLALGSNIALRFVESALEADAAVINQAGRQRMLSQRVASLTQRLLDLSGTEGQSLDLETAAQLNSARAEWRENHAALLTRESDSDSIVDALQSLTPLIELVDSQVEELEFRLGEADAAGRIAASRQLESILVSTDAYLEQMDATVMKYQNDMSLRLARLRLVENLVAVLVPTFLLLLALFVFEPGLRNWRRQEEELIGLRRAIDKHMLFSLTDRRGRIVKANDGFCELSGYTRDELVGNTHSVVNSGFHPRSFWHEMWGTLAAGQPWRAEVCNRNKHGEIYWVESTNLPQFDSRGRITGFLSLRFDITARKAAEAELLQAHRYTQSLLDAAHQFAIVAADSSGLITLFNRGAENLLGYTAEEMVGKQTPAIIHLESEAAARGEELTRQLGREISGFDVFVWSARQGGHEDREWTYVRKDGSQFPVLLTVTAVYDDNGELTGFLGIAKDITEQKAAEERLEAQREEMRSIFDAIPGLLYYKNVGGFIIDCNEAAARRMRQKREDLHGKHISELLPATTVARLSEIDDEVVSTGTANIGQIEQFDYLGQNDLYLSCDTTPLFGPAGKVERLVAIATDVTDVINASKQIEEAEHRLDMAMHASDTGLWDWEVPTGKTYYNDVVFSMLGYEAGDLEMTIDTWKDLCHPDDLTLSSRALARHIDGETEHYSCEYRIRRQDGKYVWIRDVGQIVERDQYDLPKRIVGVYISIQELHNALDVIEASNEEMQEAKQRFELAIEGSRDAIFDWDVAADKMYLSPRWAELIKIPIDSVGDTLFDILNYVVPEHMKSAEQEIQQFLAADRRRLDLEFQVVDSNRRRIWVMLRAAALRDEEGKAVRVSGSVADITSLKDVQKEMERLVQQDHLTGLASRSRLMERLEHAVARSKRSNTFCGILFFDFDRFKVVNDSLGHDVGDKLLCSIAERLTANIRETDTAARFGGDEFVILLEDLNSPREAEAVAGKLLSVCEQPHSIDGHSLVSTASIGYVTTEYSFAETAELLRYADAAMYEAKRRGRCRAIKFDKTMYDAQQRQAELEEDMQLAIERNEFHLCYQPIVDLETGQIVSAEALLRWEHSSKGNIPPDDFIPIAEESRQIVSIGAWVVAEACRQLADWRRRGLVSDDFSVSINASKVQLLTAGFEPFLTDQVDCYGIPRHLIKIEVTETTIVDNRSDISDVLRSLQKSSFVIMMDDFGTGHSSLSVLHNLPIDELKIDQSFIRNADRNRDLVAITSSIVTLAEHLNMRTIGEGIESLQHVALLQTLGCNYGQGYHWSKPVRAKSFEELLAEFAIPMAGRSAS